jgi:hypothetical protein
METNTEAPLGELEKLALLSDAINDLFPNYDRMMVFELDKPEYDKIMGHFREIDRHHKQFLIDISGVEFYFMLKKEAVEIPKEVPEETPDEPTEEK